MSHSSGDTKLSKQQINTRYYNPCAYSEMTSDNISVVTSEELMLLVQQPVAHIPGRLLRRLPCCCGRLSGRHHRFSNHHVPSGNNSAVCPDFIRLGLLMLYYVSLVFPLICAALSLSLTIQIYLLDGRRDTRLKEPGASSSESVDQVFFSLLLCLFCTKS